MIHWPAIIQYAGQAELGYVPDQSVWESDPHLQMHAWQPVDRLIDSRGGVHALRQGTLPQPTAHSVALDALLHYCTIAHHPRACGASRALLHRQIVGAIDR